MTLNSSEIVRLEELCHSSLVVSVSTGRVEEASCVCSERWVLPTLLSVFGDKRWSLGKRVGVKHSWEFLCVLQVLGETSRKVAKEKLGLRSSWFLKSCMK